MSSYQIICYSFFVPKRVTKQLFDEEADYGPEILRIKRYCHCDIQEDTTKLTVFQDEYYVVIKIKYDKKMGDHFSCMRMLDTLFNQINVSVSQPFKCISHRFILRDIKGMYHIIILKRESFQFWFRLQSNLPPITVDKLISAGEREKPPQCHTPDLPQNFVPGDLCDEQIDCFDSEINSSEDFTCGKIKDNGSIFTIPNYSNKLLGSECNSILENNRKDNEQHQWTNENSGKIEKSERLNKYFISKIPAFEDKKTLIFRNIDKSCTGSNVQEIKEALNSNCSNNKTLSGSRNTTMFFDETMSKEIDSLKDMKAIAEYNNSTLEPGKDLDALVNRFPRFLKRCREALPQMPTKKVLDEIMLILDKEKCSDAQSQKSDANYSEYDSNVNQLDVQQLESITNQAVANVEKVVFRSLYKDVLNFHSTTLAKKDKIKVAAGANISEISEAISRIPSDIDPREVYERSYSHSSIKWTNLEGYHIATTETSSRKKLSEGQAAVQAAAAIEKTIRTSQFSRRCSTFEIDKDHHMYSFSNQRPILKAIYEDLLKEVISGIVKPCIKSGTAKRK